MPFDLEFKLFLGDLRFEQDQFQLLIERNNKKIYEINFERDNSIIKEIYLDMVMENDYTLSYTEFKFRMEEYLVDYDIENMYIDDLDLIVDFTKYYHSKSILMIINEQV